MVEEAHLKCVKYGFESHWSYKSQFAAETREKLVREKLDGSNIVHITRTTLIVKLKLPRYTVNGLL